MNSHTDYPARVQFRRVRCERSDDGTTMTAFCPRRGQVIDVHECRTCAHGRGLCIDAADHEVFVRCAWAQDTRPQPVQQSSVHDALSAVMTANVRCVAPDAELKTVLALFQEHGIGAAPVVDASGRAIGIITKTDLLRACDSDDAANACAQRVREVMSHVVFTLHAGADVSRAAALMGYEGIHHLVVTTADGKPAGIISSLDILRWLARERGYLMPGRK